MNWSTFLFISTSILGIYRPSALFPGTVLVLSDSCSPCTHVLWRLSSWQFNVHVDFIESLKPFTADAFWHQPTSSNWTLRLWDAIMVRVNTFLLECHFCYSFSFCPKMFTYLSFVSCDNHVVFHRATKHAPWSILELYQHVQKGRHVIAFKLLDALLDTFLRLHTQYHIKNKKVPFHC